MSKPLHLHKNCSSQHQVAVDWIIHQDQISFEFKVSNYNPHQNSKFGNSYQDNWGLWEHDVVEVFIKKENTNSYLEIQTSPLGQPFALIIEKPRVEFHAPESLSLNLENAVDNKTWISKLTLSLDNIPGSGEKLIGNCFACLGSKDNREYFALRMNQDEHADFHRPELFVELGELK